MAAGCRSPGRRWDGGSDARIGHQVVTTPGQSSGSGRRRPPRAGERGGGRRRRRCCGRTGDALAAPAVGQRRRHAVGADSARSRPTSAAAAPCRGPAMIASPATKAAKAAGPSGEAHGQGAGGWLVVGEQHQRLLDRRRRSSPGASLRPGPPPAVRQGRPCRARRAGARRRQADQTTGGGVGDRPRGGGDADGEGDGDDRRAAAARQQPRRPGGDRRTSLGVGAGHAGTGRGARRSSSSATCSKVTLGQPFDPVTAVARALLVERVTALAMGTSMEGGRQRGAAPRRARASTSSRA